MRQFAFATIIFFLGLSQIFAAQQIMTSTDLLSPSSAAAQSPSSKRPSWVRFTGIVPSHASTRLNLIFAIYKDQQGGEPLWQETQNVDVDAAGHYSTLLGLSSPEGVPQSIFTSSDAQWLGIRVNNGPEPSRVLLVTVPYAMKAQSADALSGVPASGYVLRSELPQILQSLASQPASAPAASPTTSSSTLAVQAAATSVSNPTTVMQSNSTTDVLLVEQDGNGFSLHAVGTGNSAIFAETPSQTFSGYTVLSLNHAPGGVGLRAESDANIGHGFGLWGVAYGDTATGVLGENPAAKGNTYGVRGKVASDSGTAIFANSTSTIGSTIGLRAQTNSPAGIAGVFDAYTGGNIFSGRSSGVEKFWIDGAGNATSAGIVTAASFAGDGSKLSNLNASFLGGLPASSFLQSDGVGNIALSAGYLGGLPASSYSLAGSPTNQSGQQSLVSAQLQINPDPTSQSQFGFAGFVRDDLDSVKSIIGQAGSQTHFRLSRATPDIGGAKDFLIVPYTFGMAIEYPGTIEVWSADLSVHANQRNGNFDAARFWVGDQFDTGGLFVTANLRSLSDTGNVILAADKFDHSSHGTMNFVTRNQTDAFRFMNGPLNFEKLQAQLFTTPSTSNFEVDSGSTSGAMLADSAQNAIQIGARTGNRVDVITADSTPQLSVFPNGDVSIGSTVDSAKLAVGSSAQFQISSAGAVTIGGGTPIIQHISVTAPLSITGLSPGSCTVMTVTAAGAADSDSVALGIPNTFASAGDLVLFGWVSAPDTVSIRTCNMGSTDPGALSGTARVDVWRH